MLSQEFNRRTAVVNSELLLSQRRKKLVAAIEDEISPKLKRRMSRAVFVVNILGANAALALAANVIVRLLTN